MYIKKKFNKNVSILFKKKLCGILLKIFRRSYTTNAKKKIRFTGVKTL